MPDNQLGMIPGRACAAQRLATALLHSLGNSQVTLRLANPSSGDTKSQLGLETPTAGDLQISPALVKPLKPGADGNRRMEIVLSASGLQPIAENYGVEDIGAWLRSSGLEGVVYGGQLMRIASVSSERFFGVDCLFHITATE